MYLSPLNMIIKLEIQLETDEKLTINYEVNNTWFLLNLINLRIPISNFCSILLEGNVFQKKYQYTRLLLLDS